MTGFFIVDFLVFEQCMTIRFLQLLATQVGTVSFWYIVRYLFPMNAGCSFLFRFYQFPTCFEGLILNCSVSETPFLFFCRFYFQFRWLSLYEKWTSGSLKTGRPRQKIAYTNIFCKVISFLNVINVIYPTLRMFDICNYAVTHMRPQTQHHFICKRKLSTLRDTSSGDVTNESCWKSQAFFLD